MHKCEICNKTYKRRFDLKRHKKDKHEDSEKHECYMCEKSFHRKQFLNNHLKRKHGVVMHDYEEEGDDDDDDDGIPLPMERAECGEDDVRFHEEFVPGNYSQWDKNPRGDFKEKHSKPMHQFEHPFCMMVAGPSRSGKTYWVAKLLMTKDKRIHPTPDRIVYCYRHWQKLYTKLRMHDPAIRWHQGLPSSVFMDKLEDTIVVVDDLMDVGMNDPMLMSMFTEGSHHKNISVIFIVQNLLHQGRKSRSLNLNAQYLVLYKNPRDMRQIKTIAQQMYPTDWKRFLAYFEMETSRPYGKVIIDLHPNTDEKNRFMNDDDSSVKNDDKHTLHRMQSLQKINQPYTVAMQNKQEEMSNVLSDRLMTDSEKAFKYEQMMSDFLAYKKQVVRESPQEVQHIAQPPPATAPPAVVQAPLLQAPIQSTPWLQSKLLTPPTTLDPSKIPLPYSSSSEDDVPKTQWRSYSDDEEDDTDDMNRGKYYLRKQRK